VAKIKTYYHTIKYLRPIQVFGQILRFLPRNKRVKAGKPSRVRRISLVIPELDCDNDFIRRFRLDMLLQGKVFLLNRLGLPDYSAQPGSQMSPLWLYNLHYFEYAVALGAEYNRTGDKKFVDTFERMYKSYISAKARRYPYVISMHITNLLIAMELFGDALGREVRDEIINELFSQYQFLLRNQEKHLLGNHYFENIKAIIFGSYVFGDDSTCKAYFKKLRGQVAEQILTDGMHFELSPMYSKIVLEDLIRLLIFAQQVNITDCDWIEPIIKKMVDCLASLENRMGRTPLFNDSGDDVAKSTPMLLAAAKRLFKIEPSLSNSFPESGYYKLYNDNLALLFDAGAIGPDYMPGHGHCDCLSFELSRENTPLFVNSGTYQYQGDLRKYFRSTKAHNTVMIDGQEQSECWGEHRVARRISHIHVERKGQSITGSYRNYLGNIHKRILTLSDKVLTVLDSTVTDKSCTIQSFLHIAPDYSIVKEDKHLTITQAGDTVCRIFPLNCIPKVHTKGELTHYAPKFGIILEATCIEFIWQSDSKQHGYAVNFE
jgi:uncharacterized heparinase superfamily protein